MSEIKLLYGDCLKLLGGIKDKSVDLVLTDPPYQINNTNAGGNSKLSKSIQHMNDEIRDLNIINGFDIKIFEELERVMKVPNMYFWCNKEQIPMYIDYFVNKKKYSFDILCWVKTNAMPLFNNKYLTDKEYCLYFKKGGYCQPQNYNDAKTIFNQPINIKDKNKYNHPTIKPLNIIKTLIKNSSKEGDVVLDCFMGSGTTGVACYSLNRNFIGMELDSKYFEIAKSRIKECQENIFDF